METKKHRKIISLTLIHLTPIKFNTTIIIHKTKDIPKILFISSPKIHKVLIITKQRITHNNIPLQYKILYQCNKPS